MSDAKWIETPQGILFEVEGKNGGITTKIVWNASFTQRINADYSRAQVTLDNEVLRGCDPLIPFRTGMLKNSGKLGTIPGQGEVRWIAPYASSQYYRKSMGSGGEARRGGKWFERWKITSGPGVIEKVKRIAGGG